MVYIFSPYRTITWVTNMAEASTTSKISDIIGNRYKSVNPHSPFQGLVVSYIFWLSIMTVADHFRFRSVGSFSDEQDMGWGEGHWRMTTSGRETCPVPSLSLESTKTPV
jgi:hypothetical protein